MNNDDSISQITLPKSLRKIERFNALFEENKTMPYKVFVTDFDNNIIWDLDDALHRMFANTLKEVDEFLTLLLVKYGPMYKYYIYYTNKMYVNKINSNIRKKIPSSKLTVVHGNESINDFVNQGKLPGKIYQAEIHFKKIELNPSDNPIPYSEISPFIPSLDDISF